MSSLTVLRPKKRRPAVGLPHSSTVVGLYTGPRLGSIRTLFPQLSAGCEVTGLCFINQTTRTSFGEAYTFAFDVGLQLTERRNLVVSASTGIGKTLNSEKLMPLYQSKFYVNVDLFPFDSAIDCNRHLQTGAMRDGNKSIH